MTRLEEMAKAAHQRLVSRDFDGDGPRWDEFHGPAKRRNIDDMRAALERLVEIEEGKADRDNPAATKPYGQWRIEQYLRSILAEHDAEGRT